jgi:hypothetical protein
LAHYIRNDARGADADFGPIAGAPQAFFFRSKTSEKKTGYCDSKMGQYSMAGARRVFKGNENDFAHTSSSIAGVSQDMGRCLFNTAG